MKFKAYHGTTKGSSDNIINNGFKPKKFIHDVNKKNDLPGDLGSGIYGFLDDPELAFAFATKFSKPADCALIELDIEFEQSELLDLDDEQNLIQFLEAKKRFLKLAQTYFKKCVGSRNCIDGIVIELLINFTRLNAKVVKKRTYTPLPTDIISTDRGKIPLLSNFFNGTEICIRDRSTISEKKCISIER